MARGDADELFRGEGLHEGRRERVHQTVQDVRVLRIVNLRGSNLTKLVDIRVFDCSTDLQYTRLFLVHGGKVSLHALVLGLVDVAEGVEVSGHTANVLPGQGCGGFSRVSEPVVGRVLRDPRLQLLLVPLQVLRIIGPVGGADELGLRRGREGSEVARRGGGRADDRGRVDDGGDGVPNNSGDVGAREVDSSLRNKCCCTVDSKVDGNSG